MPSAQSVLIVDRLGETREVLRTVLERRGLRVYEAAEQTEGWKLAREHHPDLIVIDVEDAGQSRDGEPASPESDASMQEVPLVLLGSARRREPTESGNVYVSKPFQYVDLIRSIETILASFTQKPGATRR